jgi:hypothetical protein
MAAFARAKLKFAAVALAWCNVVFGFMVSFSWGAGWTITALLLTYRT